MLKYIFVPPLFCNIFDVTTFTTVTTVTTVKNDANFTTGNSPNLQ